MTMRSWLRNLFARPLTRPIREAHRRSRLTVEALEDRTVPSGITEFPVPTPNNGDVLTITAGPDGNLWFAEAGGNKIGRITPAGVITEFPVSTFNSRPWGIAAGPDGNVWFGEEGAPNLARITPAGVITEFPGLTGSYPIPTTGSDGNLWVTESSSNQIARVTTSGVFTQFTVPTANNDLLEWICAGPDGNLWFAEKGANQIGRLTPQGVFTEFPIPTPNSGVTVPTAGPDGNIWFTEPDANKVGRITPAGVLTEFPVPTPNSGAYGITTGPDGNLWFTEFSANQLARITPSGVVTEYPIPTANSGPTSIVTGSDGKLWFTESNANQIGVFEVTDVALRVEVNTDVDLALPGNPIFYSYRVTSTGASDRPGLTNLVLTDDNGTPDDSSDDFQPAGPLSGDGNRNGRLDPNETWYYAANARIIQDTDSNPLVSVVTVTANPGDSAEVVTGTGSASVTLLQPAISVEVIAPRHLKRGQSFRYTYMVHNNSNVDFLTLDRIQLVDNNGTPRKTTDDLSTANGKIKYVSGDSDGDQFLDSTEVWTFRSSAKRMGSNLLRSNVVVTATSLADRDGDLRELERGVNNNAAFAITLLQQRDFSKRDFII